VSHLLAGRGPIVDLLETVRCVPVLLDTRETLTLDALPTHVLRVPVESTPSVREVVTELYASAQTVTLEIPLSDVILIPALRVLVGQMQIVSRMEAELCVSADKVMRVTRLPTAS